MVEHCLAGVGSAASALAPHSTEFDVGAFGMATVLGTRTNRVGQTFERRFAAIDFKLERQKLHREDIRDLVELTTKRMEIYHLVGTLLLAFCMGWYTDSSVWTLPVWYSNLWLISNYAAVGYLIMCVWLAMYAAVASRSIGTRLLTSYNRLSLPSKDQLDSIKNPLFFNPGETFRKVFRKPEANLPPEARLGEKGQDHVEPVPMVQSEDDTQHFHTFLQELPRWLAYDTWSRICMSFGMNQMLQALSYFSMATIWSKSPLAAIMSFVSIHILSLVVMWLDLGELNHSGWDVLAISLLSLMPAQLAILLLMHEWWLGSFGESIMVILCFGAHGGWLWYFYSLVKDTSNGRFQASNFINVLEWVPGHSTSDEPEASDGKAALEDEADVQQAHTIDSKHVEMNGGRNPGLWLSPDKQKDPMSTQKAMAMSYLPVKMVKYFTAVTIFWWIAAGVIHAMVIEFDELNKFKSFTGDDTVKPLALATLQWPEPARLFKVSALHCSESRVWVSSRFSVYAMMQDTTSPLNTLAFVRDGNVDAVICGPHGCEVLSPPSDEATWSLAPLEGHDIQPISLPIPENWRLASGSWVDCPDDIGTTCTSAWLVGWDGATLFAATLQQDESKNWVFRSRFEIDPSLGLCAEGHADCNSEGPQSYDDLKALQLSEGGGTLTVLMDDGFVDVWDLTKGIVLKRMQMGDQYTSMCYGNKKIFMALESSSGPVVRSMAIPPKLENIFQPRVLEFIHHDEVAEPPLPTRRATHHRSRHHPVHPALEQDRTTVEQSDNNDGTSFLSRKAPTRNPRKVKRDKFSFSALVDPYGLDDATSFPDQPSVTAAEMYEKKLTMFR